MQLTVNGKPKAGKETFQINGSLRLNVFDWNDGLYHIELQRFDGAIWKREGDTACVDKSELDEIKKEKGIL